MHLWQVVGVTSAHLLLVDLDAELVSAWREAFAVQIAEDEVEVRQGSLLDVLPDVDAVLTAGNSYGQMDGGVDLALARPPSHREELLR